MPVHEKKGGVHPPKDWGFFFKVPRYRGVQGTTPCLRRGLSGSESRVSGPRLPGGFPRQAAANPCVLRPFWAGCTYRVLQAFVAVLAPKGMALGLRVSGVLRGLFCTLFAVFRHCFAACPSEPDVFGPLSGASTGVRQNIRQGPRALCTRLAAPCARTSGSVPGTLFKGLRAPLPQNTRFRRAFRPFGRLTHDIFAKTHENFA